MVYTVVRTGAYSLRTVKRQHVLQPGALFPNDMSMLLKSFGCLTVAGFGAIVLVCKQALEFSANSGLEANIERGWNWFQSYSTSNQVTVTWSYETSQDPMLAGPLSDVFVVPNINVLYN
jgi:hypothetical protein